VEVERRIAKLLGLEPLSLHHLAKPSLPPTTAQPEVIGIADVQAVWRARRQCGVRAGRPDASGVYFHGAGGGVGDYQIQCNHSGRQESIRPGACNFGARSEGEDGARCVWRCAAASRRRAAAARCRRCSCREQPDLLLQSARACADFEVDARATLDT
jgi:hypothetical protein